MPKRTVLIQTPSKIRIETNLLVVESSDKQAKIPLEDIWVVIIESLRCNITANALSRLTDAGAGVLFCDETHHPNGLLLPLGAHSRHAKIVKHQLAISKPLKKQLWQRIVKAKIKNQAAVLKTVGLPGFDKLIQYANEVKSDDASGREAAAAAFYFKTLLNNTGRRAGKYSKSLDYGYSILRAGIARSAVSRGWLVSQGIHHENDLNAFNLVDDLIEPFRPIVDLMVVQRNFSGDLDRETKTSLCKIFELPVTMKEKEFLVQTAIEEMLNSFKQAIIEKDVEQLVLPSLRS